MKRNRLFVSGWLRGCLSIFWFGLAAASPAAQPPASLQMLTHCSWPELEQLYRQAAPGTIHEGFARGLALYCPEAALTPTRSRITRTLWHGKIFCAAEGMLINQWCGFRAIKAQVYYGPSWLDGQPSIIMDYSQTSRVWANVRDEVREIAPGVFLGIMYQRKSCQPKLKTFFALEEENCGAERVQGGE